MLVVDDTTEMENLPKTMIDVLNSMLKDHQCLSWRVHGMPDKVVMNIMWSNPNFANPDFPQKNFTLSSTVSIPYLWPHIQHYITTLYNI